MLALGAVLQDRELTKEAVAKIGDNREPSIAGTGEVYRQLKIGPSAVNRFPHS